MPCYAATCLYSVNNPLETNAIERLCCNCVQCFRVSAIVYLPSWSINQVSYQFRSCYSSVELHLDIRSIFDNFNWGTNILTNLQPVRNRHMKKNMTNRVWCLLFLLLNLFTYKWPTKHLFVKTWKKCQSFQSHRLQHMLSSNICNHPWACQILY